MKLPSSETVILPLCILAIFFTLLFKSSVYQTIPLTEQEKLLSTITKGEPEKIVVYYHDRRPYHLTFKDNVHGLVADPINLAFKLADIPFVWRDTPARRQLNIIAANEDKSCAAGWFKTEEREQYAQFSLPIYQNKPFVAVTRTDSNLQNSSGTLEEVFYNNRHLLLVKSGYSYGAYIDDLLQKYAPWKISTTVDNRGMLRMILNHRADYCLMAEEEAIDLLFFSGINKDQFNIVYFGDMPSGNERYIICTKQVEQTTMERLNTAIEHLSKFGENE